jgi:hypothetical protein
LRTNASTQNDREIINWVLTIRRNTWADSDDDMHEENGIGLAIVRKILESAAVS